MTRLSLQLLVPLPIEASCMVVLCNRLGILEELIWNIGTRVSK